MKLLLAAVFLGSMVTTSYRSVRNQTDDSPIFTSTGERCSVHGVAVSQDLLAQNGGPLHYGDQIYIDRVGWRTVNDCMNARWRRRVDVWVPDYTSEHQFFRKFHNGRLRVWLIQAIEQGDNQ